MANYWGYRVDKTRIKYFKEELEQQRLRQGWGWDEKQNLRNPSVDEGARRNLPILNKVKKGDILLVPRLPSWSEVAIVEATADFKEGYTFEIDENLNDYGHIFPAKLLKSFVRQNPNVSGDIRASLKNFGRFWNMDNCREAIEVLISKDSSELSDSVTLSSRFNSVLNDGISDALVQNNFYEKLYDSLNDKLSNEEWEYAFVEGLRKILPAPIIVERTGGITEKEHGTDILIKYPGLLGKTYGIAIQVKDYQGLMSNSAITQINKSTEYWRQQDITIVDKYVFVTKCKKEQNLHVGVNSDDVTILFSCGVKELLQQIADSYITL